MQAVVIKRVSITAVLVIILIALVNLMMPSLVGAAGTTYYVSSSVGSDSNDGLSSATPWATLGKVNAVTLLPGDTIKFKRGDSWTGGLRILATEDGTVSDRITLTGYGSTSSARPKITGGGGTGGSTDNCIRIEGDYVTVDNLEVRACGTGTPYGINIFGKHALITNVFAGYNAAGVRFAGSATIGYAEYGRLTQSTIENNNVENVNTPSPTNDDSGAFGVLVQASHVSIDHNEINGSRAFSYDYGVDGSAIEIFATAGYALSNIYVGYNYAEDNNGFSEIGKSSSLGSNGQYASTDNITYEYNRIGADCGNGPNGNDGCNESYGITLRGASSNYGPNTNVKIQHNTISVDYDEATGGLTDETEGIVCHASCPDSTVIQDNIIVAGYQSIYVDNTNVTATGNLTLGRVATSSFKLAKASANKWDTNPLFISSTNLKLMSSSPAIDYGTIVPSSGKDYSGITVPLDGNCDTTAAPDSGAYEFVPTNC
jgi:hypothetical protein